jgi:hypothetical protein
MGDEVTGQLRISGGSGVVNRSHEYPTILDVNRAAMWGFVSMQPLLSGMRVSIHAARHGGNYPCIRVCTVGNELCSKIAYSETFELSTVQTVK